MCEIYAYLSGLYKVFLIRLGNDITVLKHTSKSLIPQAETLHSDSYSAEYLFLVANKKAK